LAPAPKVMSGHGHIPGSLLQLVIGVPLWLWPHFKSPLVITTVLHLAGAWVMWRVLSLELGYRAAALYAGIFLLSPWRLCHGGMLWEPAYLCGLAPFHFGLCWVHRERGTFWSALGIGLVLAAGIQLHASVLVLWILTALLWVRGLMAIH